MKKLLLKLFIDICAITGFIVGYKVAESITKKRS